MKTQVKYVTRDLRPWLVLAALVVATPLAYGQEATPPLPERSPEKAPVPSTDTAEPVPEVKPNLPGDKPTVAWTDPKVTAAREACDEMLADITIEFEQLDPIKKGLCGAPAPILVKSIGSDPAVAISPPATMRFTLAVALDTWLKETVQPAASVLGSQVVKLRNASSYKCRNRYSGTNTKISEHALANALDISAFEFASGQRLKILGNWPYGAPTSVAALAPTLPLPNPKRNAAALLVRDSTLAGETTGAFIAPAKDQSVGKAIVAITRVKTNPFVRPTPPPEAQAPRSPAPRTAAKSATPKRTRSAVNQVGSNPFISPLPPPRTDLHEPEPEKDAKKTAPADEGAAELPASRKLDPEDAGSFMRAVHDDACKTFETVLGPEANAAHRDHFHFDMKKRRYVKICE